MTSMHGITLLCATLAFSLCSAGAQNTTATDSPSSSAVSNNEFSSSSLQLADNFGTPDLEALPAAPEPNGGGGQYDNKSRGGGSGMSGLKDHLAFEGGFGFAAPSGSSSDYVGWGWNLTVGGGYKVNQNLTLMLEYQFMHTGLPGQIVAEAGSTSGYNHIWSFTLDPIYDITPKSAIDFYAVGGGGFYRKVTNFTNPQQQQFCYYFYCGYGTTNVVVGHFSSNQGGWSIGGGIAHRFAGWNGDGRMKVFAEARYLDVMSPAVNGVAPNGLGVTTVAAGTKMIPVTFGVRW